ncbi:MAG: hypothetical protein AUK30_08820 [Nitrospirae bacterium CG2_30_70_394]|nr:MAG: hypothetical protein AUK30_08820 [Nitrospirae bacterium CG2_30_70_394]
MEGDATRPPRHPAHVRVASPPVDGGLLARHQTVWSVPLHTVYGKLAVTVIEKQSHRAVRIAYRPTLQRQIGESACMTERGLGIPPDAIPEAE